MRPILAYSNAALPETADEGQQYINIKTGETFTYTSGKWVSPKITPTPVDKGTLEPVDMAQPRIEEPVPIIDPIKPKKTTRKKKVTK